MRIAVAADRPVVDSPVCPTAGRAPYYLVFDNNSLLKTIKNPFARGGGGAGFGVAHLLAEEGVDIIVAGRIGDNMRSALEEKGITGKEVTGKTVKEVVNDILG